MENKREIKGNRLVEGWINQFFPLCVYRTRWVWFVFLVLFSSIGGSCVCLGGVSPIMNQAFLGNCCRFHELNCCV